MKIINKGEKVFEDEMQTILYHERLKLFGNNKSKKVKITFKDKEEKEKERKGRKNNGK